MKKAKSGSSLGMKSVKAGYDKNPSVTRADIIVAAKKKAKGGAKIKKAQLGLNQTAEPSSEPTLRTRQYKRLGRLSAKNPSRAKKVASRMVERATREERGKKYMTKNVSKFTPAVPTVQKKGGVTKKKMMGGGKMMMKSGGKMTKKCKYGCK